MITQSEADTLVAMQKKRETDEHYGFPVSGELLTMPIISIDESEKFLIDVSRKGKFRLKRCTYQERYRGMIILIRLDIDGPPHDNPELYPEIIDYLIPYAGQNIECPHLHLYVEGFNDKWAVPTPTGEFTNKDDLYATLDDFFNYCNIIEPPIVERGLF